MKVLDFYVARFFLKYFLVVLLVPGVLFSLFELISVLDDVGKGDFTTLDAVSYILLTAPDRLLQLVPVVAFLAVVASLGRLADRGELMAMEAVGRSVLGVFKGILAGCVALVVVALVVGEFVVPRLDQRAAAIHLKTRAERGVTYTQGGVWVKRAQTFINVGTLAGNTTAEHIDIFEFDTEGALKKYISALSALVGNDVWTLQNVTIREIKGLETNTTTRTQLTIPAILGKRDLHALELSPESLSAVDLWFYIKALEKGRQNTDHFVLALWRKLTQPLFAIALALLGTGVVFQSVGRGTMGSRLALGLVVGLGFYFFDQMSMQLGLLWNIKPVIIAFLPVVVAAAWAFVQVRKVL